jgi:hypothetical protein
MQDQTIQKSQETLYAQEKDKPILDTPQPLNLLDMVEGKKKQQLQESDGLSGDKGINKKEHGDTTYRRPVSAILALPIDQFKALKPEELAGINAAQLGDISVERLRLLSSEQLNGLLRSTYARTEARHPGYENTKGGAPILGWEKGVSYYTNVTAPGLTMFRPEQLQGITTEQLQGLPNDILSQLGREQVAALSTQQIADLKPEQIQAMCAGDKYYLPRAAYFSPAQARALSAEQLKNVGEPMQQVLAARSLTATEIANLSSDDLKSKLKHLSAEQIPTITPAQIRGITPDEIGKAFSTEQVGSLTAKQLEAMSPEQYRQFMTSGFNYLRLSNDLVRELPDRLLQSIPQTILNEFVLRHVESMTPQQRRAFTPEQLSTLSEYQKEKLWLGSRTPAEISALNHTKAVSIMRHSALLTPEQFVAMSPNNVRYIVNFTDEQVAVMTAAQANAVSRDRSALSPAQEETLIKKGHLRPLEPGQPRDVPAQRFSLLPVYSGEGPRTDPSIKVETPNFIKDEIWYYADGVSDTRVTYGSKWPRSLQYTLLTHRNADGSSEERRLYADGHATLQRRDARGVGTISEFYPNGKVVDITPTGRKTYNVPQTQVRQHIANIRREIER